MERTMESVSPVRWTSADLEYLPDKEDARDEIIGRELLMTNLIGAIKILAVKCMPFFSPGGAKRAWGVPL